MSEQHPEYVWAFPPEKRRGRRGWLIGVLSAVAVAIAIALLLFFTSPWNAPSERTPIDLAPPTSPAPAEPADSTTPDPTPSVTPPSPSAVATPPEPRDPSLATFAAKVSPVLRDAEHGLEIIAESDEQESAHTTDLLLQDASRLTEAVAPSSVATIWRSALDDYLAALNELRSAIGDGDQKQLALSSAADAVNRLYEITGEG